MAGELLKKLNELKKLVVERSNAEFKKDAVELVKPDKLEEDCPCEEPSPVVNITVVEQPEVCCEVPQEENPEERKRRALEMAKEYFQETACELERAASNWEWRARMYREDYLPELADLFAEFAREDYIRAVMLRTAMEIYGLNNIEVELEGRRRAFHALAKAVFESQDFEKDEQNLMKVADELRKNFDFVNEYTKNKAEYNKEKIANAINDLIAGRKDLESAVDIIVKDGKKLVKADKKEEKKSSKKDKNGDE